MNTLVLVILLIVIVAIVIAVIRWSVRTIPEANAAVVERSGRYRRTLMAGPHIMIPLVDRIRALVDLRVQMLSLRPQQVPTSDQLKVTVEAVIYFRVTDPRAATYEVVDYASDLHELSTTTLSAVAGGMDMETALRSRNEFSSALKTELGYAARDWGLRVTRVELKALEPPSEIQQAIERYKRVEFDKNAAELHAQGQASSLAIWANAEATAQAMRAHGEAERITKVFQAIAGGSPEQQQLMLHILQLLSNLPPVSPPEVGPIPRDSQGFGLRPSSQPPDGNGIGLCRDLRGFHGRGRSSTLPSAVTRVSKAGWRAVAGPCTTVPSVIKKVDPCHGQATQAPPRSTTIRPWCSGPPRCEHRSDSTLTSGPCRYTSSDRYPSWRRTGRRSGSSPIPHRSCQPSPDRWPTGSAWLAPAPSRSARCPPR